MVIERKTLLIAPEVQQLQRAVVPGFGIFGIKAGGEVQHRQRFMRPEQFIEHHGERPVGAGVRRPQRNGTAQGGFFLGQPVRLVQQLREIEPGFAVVGARRGGPPVGLLRLREPPERAQRHTRRVQRFRIVLAQRQGALARRRGFFMAGEMAQSEAQIAAELRGLAQRQRLAVELAPLRVNVISPGLIQGTAAYAAMQEAARTGMYANVAARLPAGLVGDADSVAGPALALLASPHATPALCLI